LSSLVIVDDLFGRVVPAAVILERHLGFFDRQIEPTQGTSEPVGKSRATTRADARVAFSPLNATSGSVAAPDGAEELLLLGGGHQSERTP
jgi:hypothetical protein